MPAPRKLFFFFSVLLLAACQPAPTAVPTETVTPSVVVEIATATVQFFATPTPETATPTPGPTATAAPVQHVSPRDGMIQIQIPAGTLHMGGYDVNADDDEEPRHDVIMKSFWMDQLEVTNGMYALCIQEGACPKDHPIFSQQRSDYFFNPEYRDYPVVSVSWEEAATYCQWAGRRLPTEAEWERAARGDDLRTYPWGYEPPSWVYANSGNLVHDTSRVGSYAAGASPYGILDMAGNVWEWVDDLYDDNYYQTAATENPVGPTQVPGRYLRVIRGGSYQDNIMEIRVSNRGNFMGSNLSAPSYDPSRYGPGSVKIGFRCAADN